MTAPRHRSRAPVLAVRGGLDYGIPPASSSAGVICQAMFGLAYTPAEEAFRVELRAWLEANLPRAPAPEDEGERRRFQRAWQRALAAGGWVGMQWPRAHGGRGASLREQIIFTEEMARARAPEILDPVSVNIVGPTLIRFGTPAQQARWLPPIRPADQVWCLGFSEPNAGSDLASLRCRAVRDGDHWVVSGQKVWSSKAHFADWCLLLVRTDPVAPKHAGITCLVVDMRAPGITWRPLVQLSGRSEFNELFLEDVRVPVENVVGPVNGGWPIIRAALAHERGTLWAFDFKVRLQNGSRALADLYPRCPAPGRGELVAFRPRVAQAWIEAEVFGAHTLRIPPPPHAAAYPPPPAAVQQPLRRQVQQPTPAP